MAKKRLLILGILVIILTAIIIAAVMLLSGEKPDDEESLIVVAEVDPNQVQGMSIRLGDSEVSLIKQDGVWQYQDNAGAEVDQLITESALTYVSYVYADSIARQSVQDLQQYGLDPAVMTVQLKQTDNTSIVYRFGMPTADQKGVFFQKEGDDRLYIFGMDKYQQVVAAVENLRDLSLDIDTKALIAFSLMRISGERQAMEFYRADTDSGQWYINTPFYAKANPKLAQLVEVLFSPPRLAGYESDTLLPVHGITKDSAFLRMEDDKGKNITLMFGNRTEDGAYYCTVSDREGVYSAYSGMEELLNVDTINVISPSVFAITKETLPAFTLNVGNTEFTLAVNEKGYSLNGQLLTKEQIAAIAEQMAAITIDGLALEADVGDKKAHYVLHDNSEYEIDFSVYNKDFLAMSMTDTPYAYVKTEKFAIIVDLLDSMLQQQ